MTAARRRRGRDTELILADYLRGHGWPYAQATGAGAAGSDILNTPAIAWEAKARRGLDLGAAMRQNADRPAAYHPVVIRLDGQGPAAIGDWPAVLPLSELVALLAAAGYATEGTTP